MAPFFSCTFLFFDRLVLVYQGNQILAADVIDFKSDSVTGSNLQQRIEYYRPQLGAYRSAVSKFARIPVEKVSTRLVFLETGQVDNLDLVDSSVDTHPAGLKNRKPKRLANRQSAHDSGSGPQQTDSALKKSGKSNQSNLPPKPKFHDDQQKTFWD